MEPAYPPPIRRHARINLRVHITQVERLEAIAAAVYGGNLSAAARDVLAVGLKEYSRVRQERIAEAS